MSKRFFTNLPSHVKPYHTWGNNPGYGKYMKRRLHKARRRFAKALLREGEEAYRHMKGLTRIEAEVNWKSW